MSADEWAISQFLKTCKPNLDRALLLPSQASTVMRHALPVRGPDGTRAGPKTLKKLLSGAHERAFAATVTEANSDSKLLLTLLF